ncbi:MAG: polysulfide reductase NrfD, partial [Deltaproteobacteria bacterium]|nr:polysulfide reductase NrfD [Deltaproteobacteria bacterium]
FGDKDLKLVANMALVAALCFIFFCMTPLLFHLGKPFRCFNITFTPNLQSAMSMFGYICFFYMGVLLVEIWLVFRKDIIERAKDGFIIKRLFYALLALGVTEISDESLSLDKNIRGVLAAIGIPSSCVSLVVNSTDAYYLFVICHCFRDSNVNNNLCLHYKRKGKDS